MVVEYQTTSANNTYKDDDIVEIKQEPQEKNPRVIIIVDPNTQLSQVAHPETLSTSQKPVDHEEVVSAQDPFDQPQDEIEDWSTILSRGRQQEKWGREGIHEDDLAIMIADRADPAPTNRDLISYIYGYYERDDPTIPTARYYRWCKPPTSIEELHRREGFGTRRRQYFDGPAVKIGNNWYPERYLPDPEDPEWSWKEGLELDKPAMSV